nr:hypothetical protein Iba_scaffold29629CG0010 [Ipomoea batatas]GMD73200.1 hypothetical protein Iba_chr12fCG16050 [Ipomoea batatas]
METIIIGENSRLWVEEKAYFEEAKVNLLMVFAQLDLSRTLVISLFLQLKKVSLLYLPFNVVVVAIRIYGFKAFIDSLLSFQVALDDRVGAGVAEGEDVLAAIGFHDGDDMHVTQDAELAGLVEQADAALRERHLPVAIFLISIFRKP